VSRVDVQALVQHVAETSVAATIGRGPLRTLQMDDSVADVFEEGDILVRDEDGSIYEVVIEVDIVKVTPEVVEALRTMRSRTKT
jgi:hypothetical protein